MTGRASCSLTVLHKRMQLTQVAHHLRHYLTSIHRIADKLGSNWEFEHFILLDDWHFIAFMNHALMLILGSRTSSMLRAVQQL